MNDSQILQIIMWLIGGGGLIITGLIAYIWKSYINRQDMKQEKQAEFNRTLIGELATLNTIHKIHEDYHKHHFSKLDKHSEAISKLEANNSNVK